MSVDPLTVGCVLATRGSAPKTSEDLDNEMDTYMKDA